MDDPKQPPSDITIREVEPSAPPSVPPPATPVPPHEAFVAISTPNSLRPPPGDEDLTPLQVMGESVDALVINTRNGLRRAVGGIVLALLAMIVLTGTVLMLQMRVSRMVDLGEEQRGQIQALLEELRDTKVAAQQTQQAVAQRAATDPIISVETTDAGAGKPATASLVIQTQIPPPVIDAPDGPRPPVPRPAAVKIPIKPTEVIPLPATSTPDAGEPAKDASP